MYDDGKKDSGDIKYDFIMSVMQFALNVWHQ